MTQVIGVLFVLYMLAVVIGAGLYAFASIRAHLRRRRMRRQCVTVLTEYTRKAVAQQERIQQVAELSRLVTANWLLAADRERRRGIEARC